MSTSMDPEVEAALAGLPPLQFADPAAQRRAFAEWAKQMPQPPPDERTTVEKLEVPCGEQGGVPVRVFRPRDASGSLPVVVWVHGGAYVVGSASQDDLLCSDLAVRTGAVVVSVEYRLAPEHPYPGALDDCYAAACWAAAGGVQGTDPARLAIAGASAGAGLAAAVALYARDHGGPPIAFQLLLYPYLDDQRGTPSTGPAATRRCSPPPTPSTAGGITFAGSRTGIGSRRTPLPLGRSPWPGSPRPTCSPPDGLPARRGRELRHGDGS